MTPDPAAEAMEIRAFVAADEPAVVDLWRRCDLVRPWNDPHRDVERKRAVQPELFLVGVLAGEIVASVMAGYEGHRGWLNYLAVDPRRQRRGVGRSLVEHAEKLLRAAGCPKINLQVRTGNRQVLEFYRRLGYVVDDVVSLGKRLEVDSQGPAPQRGVEATGGSAGRIDPASGSSGRA